MIPYTPRRIFFFGCLMVSILCLVTGYSISGDWWGIAAAIITGTAWLPAHKYPNSGLPFICLMVSVTLAVVGIINGSSALLMICSSGFALAAWDLLFLDNALGRNPSEEKTRIFENTHLQSLVLALSSGLIIVFLGRFLRLEMPFFILLVLVAAILFGFVRMLGFIKKAG